MGITFTPIELETGSSDREGLLVKDGNRLLAILVRLSDIHAEQAGSWHLEYGCGFSGRPETFASLDHAKAWINKAKRSG